MRFFEHLIRPARNSVSQSAISLLSGRKEAVLLKELFLSPDQALWLTKRLLSQIAGEERFFKVIQVLKQKAKLEEPVTLMELSVPNCGRGA